MDMCKYLSVLCVSIICIVYKIEMFYRNVLSGAIMGLFVNFCCHCWGAFLVPPAATGKKGRIRIIPKAP